MTQSFDSSITTDKDWVRFHIADTNSEGMYLDDETINYFIDDVSKENAVIVCIKNIIMQLSAPNTKLDWLTISFEEARKGYEKMLAEKENEFGIHSVSLSTVTYHPWRADSDQTHGDYSLDDDD